MSSWRSQIILSLAIITNDGSYLWFIIKVLAAMLAGCTEALLTPFERVQTLMLDDKYRWERTRTKFKE